MFCDCGAYCIPLPKGAAKISSPFVTSVNHNKDQFIGWHRTACMISSIEKEKEDISKRHHLCAIQVHPVHRKCYKHQESKSNISVK